MSPQTKANLLQKSLQTNKPIEYWHRGNPHPTNPKYIFVQYIHYDRRCSNLSKAISHNNKLYRKENTERWVLETDPSPHTPKKIERKESLNKQINSKLQTKQPKNTFKQNDIHPTNKKYLFKSYRPSKTTPEQWIHKNSKTAKCIATKNVTKIPQSKLKTGLPKGTFKRGDQHPTEPNLVYDKWNSKYNQERWFTPEDHIKYIENHKAHYEIPENRKRKNLACRAYQSTKEYKQKRRIERAIRYATDPHFVLRKLISGRIRNALRNFKANKYFSSQKLVGCTLLKLRQHLESQFTVGMSWKNQGAWHIDHIIPCASFDLTKPSEQKKCFHYSNLQPLWACDNLSKSSKLNWQKAA